MPTTSSDDQCLNIGTAWGPAPSLNTNGDPITARFLEGSKPSQYLFCNSSTADNSQQSYAGVCCWPRISNKTSKASHIRATASIITPSHKRKTTTTLKWLQFFFKINETNARCILGQCIIVFNLIIHEIFRLLFSNTIHPLCAGWNKGLWSPSCKNSKMIKIGAHSDCRQQMQKALKDVYKGVFSEQSFEHWTTTETQQISKILRSGTWSMKLAQTKNKVAPTVKNTTKETYSTVGSTKYHPHLKFFSFLFHVIRRSGG